MPGRSYIFYLLLFLQSISYAVSAQHDADSWIFKEILKDSAFTGEILSHSFREEGPLFEPADLNPPSYYTGYDNLIKNKNGLFKAIEGTGRLYKISLEADELKFTRIDSTVFVGYNNGAFVYSFKDTIYSLGGYGFWSLNGQLRYFRQSTLGWEIKPVNRKIPVANNNRGLYYDQNNYFIYFVTSPGHVDETLKKNPHDENRKNQLFELNINTNDWKEIGTVTSEYLKLSTVSIRIATLPWGELYLTGPGAQPKYPSTLYDYRNNRILSLNKPEKSNALFDLLYGLKSSTNKRLISYYHDSVLTILNSKQERLEIPLKISDFTDTGMSIYVPLQESVAWYKRQLLWFGIITTLSLSSLGFVFWKRRKTALTPSASERSNTIVFDQTEQELIKNFLSKPEPYLSVDEVDEILDTAKKSKDAQNQKRSSVTRSINNKYFMVTGDKGNLIAASRLELDRRMIRYALDLEKCNKIKHLLN